MAPNAIKEEHSTHHRQSLMYHVVPKDTANLDHHSLFLAAVAYGHRSVIELLINKGFSVSGDPKKRNCYTPLHVAIETGDVDVVEMLLQNKASLEATSHNGQTPLHFAVKSKQKNMVTLLLDYGADWKVVDDYGKSVLHLAVEESWRYWNEEKSKRQVAPREIIEILEMFLLKRMDVNVRTKNGQTPLHFAVRQRMKEVVAYLLLRGADIHVCDDMGNGVIHMSIIGFDSHSASEFGRRQQEKEKADFIEWLMLKGARADVRNYDQQSPIDLAAESDQIRVLNRLHIIFDRSVCWKETEPVVRLMIKMDANDEVNVDVNFTGDFTMMNNKQIRVLCALLITLDSTNDSDTLVHVMINTCINKDNITYPDITCQDLAVTLIDKATDVKIKNNNNMIPLHFAAKYKYKRLLEYLLDHGADAKVCTYDGYNALHFLSLEYHPNIRDETEMVRLLVNKGCSIHARTKESLTPFHLAAQSGCYTIVEALLQHGADVNCIVNNGITALHFAAMFGCREVVEILLKHGADVNCTEESDLSTPLHLAVHNKHDVIVGILLRSGADIIARQRNHATSIDVAADCRDRNILQNLIFHAMKLRAAGLLPNMSFVEHRVNAIARIGMRQYIINLRDYYRTCVVEMKRLRRTMVNESTSIFDVLHMDEHRLFIYRHHLMLLELEFPMYQDVILGCYRIGEVRSILIEKAKQVFMRQTESFLPECCWEHVFSFLTSKDLRNVIKARRRILI